MAKFNVQNFPKKPAFDFDLRACVKAPSGYKFLIFDLSQIEARITPYLAGDEKTIELIASGMSVYEVHARLTMGWTGGKLKYEDGKKYALAKARVLALGFGCGWQKFQIQAAMEKYGQLILSNKVAKEQVDSFRRDNPKIVRLWNRLENDFKSSIGGNYEMELPSGRIMTYYDVEMQMKAFASTVTAMPSTKLRGKQKPAYRARTTRSGRHTFIYGGLLCENLVQATARDVFGEALIRLEDAGYSTLFTVHDEGTLLVPEDWTDAVRVVEQIVSLTPPWLAGCPVGCEVIEDDHYAK